MVLWEERLPWSGSFLGVKVIRIAEKEENAAVMASSSE